MRVIWYMLDGLTPCVLRAFNSGKKVNNKLAPLNFIDKLAKNSFKINRCYGYGETMASNSAMVSGKNCVMLKSDMLAHPDSFHLCPTVASYLQKKGFYTIFYRNFPLDGLRRKGPYKRFNLLEAFGFNRVILEDDSGMLFKNSKVINKHDDFFLTTKKRKTFIYIHDMAFHDDSRVLKNATKKSLFKAVVEKGERVKRNLEYLKYDKNKDILIFSSDHGMTLSPYDDMFYDKHISKDTMDLYWPKLTADFKLRTSFFIKGPGINSGEARGTYEIRDVHATVLDFLNIKYHSIGAISARSKTRLSALVSTIGTSNEKTSPDMLKGWFHPYIVFVKDDKKWVYRKLKEPKCYYLDLKLDVDEDHPIGIPFCDLPSEMRRYIREYYSFKKLIYRFYCAYHPGRLVKYIIGKINLN